MEARTMTALRHAFLFAVCLVFPSLTEATAVKAAGEETITVFAAASMTEALEKLARQYNQDPENKQTTIRFSFVASSTLARQIEAGAPADIFISANEEWMDYLVAKNLIATATRVSPVGNALVIIAPADSPLGRLEIDRRLDIGALIDPDARIVTGDPTNVPVGMYAKSAFENLGLWTSVEPLLARVDNVRAALALVERGEAPLGIVYATDARASERVKVVGTFPPDSHPPITYPFAIVAGRDTPSVRRFFRHLTTGPAAAVYESLGFQWRGPTG
jgi:molybdate transport system substrate-binding protein